MPRAGQLKPEVATQIVDKLIEKERVPIITGVTFSNVMMAVHKNSTEAADSFAAAASLAPTDWQAYRGQAGAELAQGNIEAAISIFRQGIAATRGAAPLVIDLATLLEQQKRPEEAIAEYEAMLAANPTSEIAANNLAMLLVTYRKDDMSLARAEELWPGSRASIG